MASCYVLFINVCSIVFQTALVYFIDTSRALTSHDIIHVVRAISFCIACLVIVASRPFRDRFSLLSTLKMINFTASMYSTL